MSRFCSIVCGWIDFVAGLGLRVRVRVSCVWMDKKLSLVLQITPVHTNALYVH